MKNTSSSTAFYRIATRYALCLVFAAALIPICLLNPFKAEAAPETLYVKVLVARVRQAPSTASPILFKIRRGDPVVVDQEKGEWYHIRHVDDRQGWAHRNLFTATSENGGRTTGRSYFLNAVSMQVLSGTKEAVVFQVDGFQPPETFVLKGERPRVVCDFLNTRARDNIGDRIEPAGSLVKDIRVAPYGGGTPRVRIVLDLNPGSNYVVDQTFYKKENRYIVTVAAAGP